MMSHDTERAQRIEVKRRERLAVEARVDIACEHFGLTQGELSSGGTRLAVLSVGDGGAIAHRPKTRLSHHTERAVYDHRAALVLFNRQGPEQRVRRRAGGPYQSLRANLFRGTQDHFPGAYVSQASIKLERHAAFSHSRLCIAGERLAQLGQNAVPRMNEDDV